MNKKQVILAVVILSIGAKGYGMQPGAGHDNWTRIIDRTMSIFQPFRTKNIHQRRVRLANPASLTEAIASDHSQILLNFLHTKRASKAEVESKIFEIIKVADCSAIDILISYEINVDQPRILTACIENGIGLCVKELLKRRQVCIEKLLERRQISKEEFEENIVLTKNMIEEMEDNGQRAEFPLSLRSLEKCLWRLEKALELHTQSQALVQLQRSIPNAVVKHVIREFLGKNSNRARN